MKSPINALQFLLKLENCMNIHRDYLYLSIKKQVLVMICIFIEISISFGIYWSNYTQMTEGKAIRESWIIHFTTIFLFLHLSYSFFTISFYGPRYSKAFSSVLEYLHKGHTSVANNAVYKKSISNLKVTCYSTTVMFVVLLVGVDFIQFILHYRKTKLDGAPIYMYVQYLIIKTWIEFRFILAIFMFYTISSVLRHILYCLVSLVKSCEEQKATGLLKTCAICYYDVFECNNQLIVCFRFPVMISLIIAAVHMIALMYRYIQICLKGQIELSNVINLSGTALMYGWCLVAGAVAGQRVRRECDRLQLCLAQMCCVASTMPESPYFKTLKDFHRLVTVKPVVSKLTQPGSPLGMPLVPAALSLIVTYIIVLLQLNHDV